MNPLSPPAELRPYQLEIVQAVTDSVYGRRGLTFSVEIARQGGKNELSAWLQMQLLMAMHDLPLNIVKCARDFPASGRHLPAAALRSAG